MADENRIIDVMLAPDSNTRRFHQGDAPQWLPFAAGDPEPTEEELAALALHRAQIHAPTAAPRFGTDEDGNPIEVPPSGLVFNEETGGVDVLEPDGEAPATEEPAPAPAPTTTTATSTTSKSGTTSTSGTTSSPTTTSTSG